MPGNAYNYVLATSSLELLSHVMYVMALLYSVPASFLYSNVRKREDVR